MSAEMLREILAARMRFATRHKDDPIPEPPNKPLFDDFYTHATTMAIEDDEELLADEKRIYEKYIAPAGSTPPLPKKDISFGGNHSELPPVNWDDDGPNS